MEHAYLSSLDSHAVREIQQAHRLWLAPLDSEGHAIPGRMGLMQEWSDAIARLTRRLANISTYKPETGKTSALLSSHVYTMRTHFCFPGM